MRDAITPERIANSMQQESDFEGTFLLVEGVKDLKLFKKFVCDANGKLKITHGKHKMREIYQILQQRGFDRMLGIRDADFIRVNGNEKFDANYAEAIYLTDAHDSESMILLSNALENLLVEVSSDDKIEALEQTKGSIRHLLFDLTYPIGCLRYANKKFDLGLAFKPKSPEGNKLKLKKIICEKTLSYLGDEKLVTTVLQYSTNRGRELPAKEVILEKLNEVKSYELSPDIIANGHDLSEALFILIKKGLKSSSKSIQDASCVEELMRIAYSDGQFKGTSLFESLTKWQQEKNLSFFLIQ